VYICLLYDSSDLVRSQIYVPVSCNPVIRTHTAEFSMRLPLLLALALAATIALAQYQQLQQIFRQASADRSASLRENSQQLSQNPIATSKSKEGYRYYNDETSGTPTSLLSLYIPILMLNQYLAYFVESMPDVPFPLGELYSGSLPIRTKASTFNGNGSLFFFFAPKFGYPVDELVIWLNGGPGWSSLEGFFQENGPITWGKGTYGPVMNAYSWSNLTNVIW